MQKTYPENATVLFRWECTAYPQLIVIDVRFIKSQPSFGRTAGSEKEYDF
jgi:hypothetical protein